MASVITFMKFETEYWTLALLFTVNPSCDLLMNRIQGGLDRYVYYLNLPLRRYNCQTIVAGFMGRQKLKWFEKPSSLKLDEIKGEAEDQATFYARILKGLMTVKSWIYLSFEKFQLRLKIITHVE